MVSASGHSTDSDDGMERWFDTDFFREDGGPPGEYELEPFPKAASSSLHSLYHDAEDDDVHYYSLPGTPRASPPDRQPIQGMPTPGGGGAAGGAGAGLDS